MDRSSDLSPDPARSGSKADSDGESAGGQNPDATTGERRADRTKPHNDGGNEATGGSADVPAGSAQTGKPASVSTPDRFDWRGWLVVVVVFVSFLVIPAFVLYLPEAHWVLTAVGLSRRQAYVVFPMVPAIVLGLTAVWAAVRTHSPDR